MSRSAINANARSECFGLTTSIPEKITTNTGPRHRKDIYQRIFISYPISKNLQKGYFISLVCLFVYTRPAGPAWLTLSFSQPHVSRRFETEKPRWASIGYRVTQIAYFLPYTCQTILFLIPVSLRKSSIWFSSPVKVHT
jgi:hypothetical protein